MVTEHGQKGHFEADLRHDCLPAIRLFVGMAYGSTIFDGDWAICDLFHGGLHTDLRNLRTILRPAF